MKIVYLIVMTALIQIFANARTYFLRRISKTIWLLALFGLTVICVASVLLIFGDLSSQELVLFLSANVISIITVAVIRYVQAIRKINQRHPR